MPEADARPAAPVDGVLAWRPLAAEDLPLLATWLAEPGVARWWHHETSLAAVERDFGPSVRGEEPGEDLVVLLDGAPVGLLQRSRIRDHAEDLEQFAALVDVPEHAMTIDYLIADPALRGRGLGTRVVAAAVARTWVEHPDAEAVLVAVVAANTASWRALEKAGFTRVAEGDLPPDDPVDDPLHVVYRIDRPTSDRPTSDRPLSDRPLSDRPA
ncbi:GNAT family N-acetyltransferase [Quadrisphaera sp. DSM 44207]|uniref:GNAT family N-acetyltransferase n=1 Tax=Quadrisphaera sp. DSM 44207 TaxID=1881057 RepID=UPI000889EEAF|nr:GNAT family N-acetyltransferase [Quadrisphaera sp. DSM 44207]SDQ12304.1 aminoglycoside 6'-N-acetyltransferase [Quadrisphaera sp. DSM 44207]